jgi:hypothetical protein
VAESAEEWRQESLVRLLEARDAAHNVAQLDSRYSSLARETARLADTRGPVTDAFLRDHLRECPQPRS